MVRLVHSLGISTFLSEDQILPDIHTEIEEINVLTCVTFSFQPGSLDLD